MKTNCDRRQRLAGTPTPLSRFRVAPFDKVRRGTDMLMITVEADAPTVTFRLDGRLAGAGIRELARSWSAAARKQPHRRVSLDLMGVTSVDSLGKDFLAQAYRQGSRLIAGAATRAIVEEVRTRSVNDCGSSDSQGRSTSVALEPTTPWTVHVEGNLQAPVNSELSQQVEAALIRGERRVLLNLSQLADIDAAGIGELVRLFNLAKAVGGCLHIADASRYVKQLLEVTGLLNRLSTAA